LVGRKPWVVRILKALHRSAAQRHRLVRFERTIAGAEAMLTQRGADLALTVGPWTLEQRSA